MTQAAPPVENPTSVGYHAPDPNNYASSVVVAARARETVKQAIAAARDARGTLPEQWQMNNDAYFGIRHRKSFRGRANVVDPEPFRVVETIFAREAKALLGTKPWLRGFPGPGLPKKDMRQAEINENLLQQQLSVGSDGYRTLKSGLKSCAILGTQFMKVQWDIETRRRQVRDPNTGRRLGPQDTPVWKGPRWRNCEIDDIFVSDPVGGECPNDMDYMIERKLVRIQDLQALGRKRILENTEGILPGDVRGKHFEDEAGKAHRAELVGANYDLHDPAKSPIGKAELEMFEGPFDLYGKGDEIACWIWLVNGDNVVRVQENPNWHGKSSYISAPCIALPGNIYGLSPIQPILDLWVELNDLHNMGLDSAVLSLNPAIKVGTAAGVDFKRWVLSPGAFLPCNDINQVEAFVLPPMTQVAHTAMGPLRQMMRETTSATDLLQAQDTGGIDKATIYQGALKEANVRIAEMASGFAGMMEDGADLHYALNQQYMQTPELVRIGGKDGFEFIPVRPEDLKYPMDWHAVGVQNVGAEMTRNFGIERFMAAYTPLALQGAVQLDFNEIAKTHWTSLGMADPDRIIAPQGPQPMDPRQEHLMMQQRQPVDSLPQENHAQHYQAHVQWAQELQSQPVQDPVVMQMLTEHIQETEAMFQRVTEAKQQMAALQAKQAMQSVEQPANGKQSGNGAPADGNQQNLGAEMGAAKSIGEGLGGRLG